MTWARQGFLDIKAVLLFAPTSTSALSSAGTCISFLIAGNYFVIETFPDGLFFKVQWPCHRTKVVMECGVEGNRPRAWRWGTPETMFKCSSWKLGGSIVLGAWSPSPPHTGAHEPGSVIPEGSPEATKASHRPLTMQFPIQLNPFCFRTDLWDMTEPGFVSGLPGKVDDQLAFVPGERGGGGGVYPQGRQVPSPSLQVPNHFSS